MSKIKNAQLRYRVIDRCLRNAYNPYPTKEDLRQACEEAIFGSSEGIDICDSTIEKDLFAMRMDFDAPIKYSKRDKGYYYEDEHYSIDKIPLSEEDVEAIKFATNTLMQFRDVGIFNQFGFAIDKIFDRVHISDNPMDEAVESYVQFETHKTKGGNSHLPHILKAIKNKQVIEFGYTNFNSGKFKERRALPLLLKEYGNRWYAITYTTEKGRITTFALDRMSDLVVTEDYFLDKFDFDSQNYFAHSVGITANEDQPVKVVLKAEKTCSKYMQELPFHPTQTLVKEGNNRDTFEMEVIISAELKRMILANGKEMEVIKPKSLRTEMANIVQEMMDNYG